MCRDAIWAKESVHLRLKAPRVVEVGVWGEGAQVQHRWAFTQDDGSVEDEERYERRFVGEWKNVKVVEEPRLLIDRLRSAQSIA